MSASNQLPSERDSELLSAYLDGALSPRDKEALEKKLLQDSTLRSELDALRSTTQLLRRLPPLKAPRDFTLDPARYQRQTAWWQRLFESGLVLQLSGAIGTTAAIALIVLALTTTSQRQTQHTAMKDEPASVALQPSQTPTLPPTAALDSEAGTAIAYSGEGLFQATLAMQSTVYAATPLTPPAVDQAQAPGALVEVAPTGTPPPAEPVAAQAFAAADDTSAAGAAPQNEPPMLSPVDEGETAALSAPPTLGPAQAAAPAPLTASTPTNAPGGQADGNLASSQVNGGNDITSQEQPSVADTTLSEEGQEAAAIATPTVAVTAPPPAERAPIERDASRQSDKELTQTSHPWWLAGIGAIVLIFSLVVFVAGRRRARP